MGREIVSVFGYNEIMDNKPVILNITNAADYKKFEKILKNKSVLVTDQIDSQLKELFLIRHPSISQNRVAKNQVNNFITTLLAGRKKKEFGRWVFYPWTNHLVHFLPEDLHQELRTARNRDLITQKEQKKFYQSHIGIAGLSVGNSAMATILHSGGGKFLRLADQDILAGSNINRIRTGFDNISLKKVVIAAREIYAVNPYADLRLYPQGLNQKNLHDFLLKPKPIDVLIEEMDNIYLKIQIRLLARKHKIPVVMVADNGDNIVLDIERFDLNPSLPLLHGDIPEKTLLTIKPDISKLAAARIIARMVHSENVAVRMQTSLLKLGKTLYSWPQLGNAAFLAGCAIAYSVRKIILDQPIKQGKFLISFDEILVPDYFDKTQIKKREQQTDRFKKIIGIN